MSSIDHDYQGLEISECARNYLDTWTSGNDDEIDRALHNLLFACASHEISHVDSLFDISIYQFLVVSSVLSDWTLLKKETISSLNARLMYNLRGIVLLDILKVYEYVYLCFPLIWLTLVARQRREARIC